MAELFLGVDGGQSSTKVVLGDGVDVRGTGSAGPCNHVKEGDGRQKLIDAVEEALAKACADAGVEREGLRLAAACCGMSGGPADKEAILRETLGVAALEVTTDAHIALYGAMGGDPGIVVIAGTGSIALGIDGDGRVARAGGWGYVFGDEGGAFDIARRALRAALRMEEGWGAETLLRERLLEESGAGSANELMHWLYTDEWPRSRVGRWASLVDDAAVAGDAEAGRALDEAASELAALVEAVRRNLFRGDRAAVTLIGGVFESERVRDAVRLQVTDRGCSVIAPRMSPAEGAWLRARALRGGNSVR